MPENTTVIESLNREELYKQVWSQPMTKTAKSYGLSDVGLAKICRKLDIPTPGRGYWRKIALGIPMQPTPLPPSETTEEKLVQLKRVEEPERPKTQLTETERKVAAEKKEENRIHVAAQLVSPHPLVEKTLRSLSSAKPDLDGRVRPKAKGCLDVCVGPDSVDRAMRIMDALIKALEARGYSVSDSDEEEGRVWVTVNEEDIHFSLEELLTRREKEVTPAEKREREKYEREGHEQLWWYIHRTEFIRFPNGRFTLTIDNYTSSIRGRWSDGAVQRIEDRLNGFVASLIRTAEDWKESRRQAEERERIRNEKEQRRREEELRKKESQWRVEVLEAKLADWQHVQQIRAFIAAIRAEAIRRYGEIEEGSEIAQWLAWAERYAIQRDPLADANELPTYTPDEETRSKLEQSLNASSHSSDYGWLYPSQPR